MESPAQEYPAGVWFADRVDDLKTRRNRLRWYAVGFNGLFLLCIDSSRLGTILLTLATFVLTREQMGRRDRMRPLAQALDPVAAVPHEPVRMEIYRNGVLLGADEGWLGRRNGALAYEGRRTRFEIALTDLHEVPKPFTTPWERTRLSVRADHDRVVEVEFRPWSPEDSARKRIQDMLTNWPWAVRQLAGPPSHPNPCRPDAYLFTRATGKGITGMLALIFGVLILSAIGKLSTEGVLAAQVVAIALLFGIQFARAYRRDRHDMARLETSDREEPLARAEKPTEPAASENVETVTR